MARILFAEDEVVLGKLVREALEREQDFNVTWVKDGQAALNEFRKGGYDVCVLDVMMPAMDGFTLAKHIRSVQESMPIIFLTARSQTADVVKGFESGGNDYLKKPFSIEELVVRVKELLRRNRHSNESKLSGKERYEIGRYIFIPATQTLKSPTASHRLSNKETELLKALVVSKNMVMDRKEILIKLWGDDNFFNARNMDVYIAKLRKYLAEDTSLAIVNIRGYGFKLIEQEDV